MNPECAEVAMPGAAGVLLPAPAPAWQHWVRGDINLQLTERGGGTGVLIAVRSKEQLLEPLGCPYPCEQCWALCACWNSAVPWSRPGPPCWQQQHLRVLLCSLSLSPLLLVPSSSTSPLPCAPCALFMCCPLLPHYRGSVQGMRAVAWPGLCPCSPSPGMSFTGSPAASPAMGICPSIFIPFRT